MDGHSYRKEEHGFLPNVCWTCIHLSHHGHFLIDCGDNDVKIAMVGIKGEVFPNVVLSNDYLARRYQVVVFTGERKHQLHLYS